MGGHNLLELMYQGGQLNRLIIYHVINRGKLQNTFRKSPMLGRGNHDGTKLHQHGQSLNILGIIHNEQITIHTLFYKHCKTD